MTERRINLALKQIQKDKTNGYLLETYIRYYHLNIEILKFILKYGVTGYDFSKKKVKIIIADLIKEFDSNQKIRGTINKKSLKTLKLWVQKTDLFFKELKIKRPRNVAALLHETEHVFKLLSLSAHKLFAHSPKKQ